MRFLTLRERQLFMGPNNGPRQMHTLMTYARWYGNGWGRLLWTAKGQTPMTEFYPEFDRTTVK